MWVTNMKSQTKNWMITSKDCNLILDDEEMYIDYNELDKCCLNQSIKVPELKTFPQPMRNLPDNKRLVDELLDYENKKLKYIPRQIEKMFKEMPFKWLSKVSDRFYGDPDVIIIDEPDDLPESIKKYIQKYYVKHFRSAGFSALISSRKNGIINENLGFKDFLHYHELNNRNFSRYEDTHFDLMADTVYLFDGIAIENFYSLYFKSGLSKEFIFRFLKNDEYTYSINYQAIEKEVEKILSKH